MRNYTSPGKGVRRKRLKVVLFDLGDTLLYFDGNWPEVFTKARQAMLGCLQQAGLLVGQDFLDDFYTNMLSYYRERDAEFVEYTTQRVLRTTLAIWGYANIPDSTLVQALAALHKVTQAHWIPEADALPTIQELAHRGYRMSLISNASDDANTQLLVDKVGIRPFMEVIVSSAAMGIRKPNPKIFQAVLARMCVTPKRAVMVGDTLGADILGARNAGMFSIWITRHADTAANRSHLDLIRPDASISTLSELPDLLEHLT
jgi:HAD superfamily hydrolase (TIGR01662 family)